MVYGVLVMQSTFKAYSAQRDSHGFTPSQLRALKIFLVCSDCFLIGEMSYISS